MKQYDTIIKETIQKNNEKIYTELLEFLAPQKMGIFNEASLQLEDGGLTV